MLLVHVAELVRNGSAKWNGLIPLVLSAGVLALGALAVGSSSRTRSRKGIRKESRSARRLRERFSELMKTEELFLDPATRLATVAANLEASPHDLSAALNTSDQGGFNDVLNGYRIDHSKRLLLDPEKDHLSIEGIGSLSGFGSRSTFYDAFRKIEGISPGEFRRNRPDPQA